MQDTHGRMGIVVTHDHRFCALNTCGAQYRPAAGVPIHDIFAGSCRFLHTSQINIQGHKWNILFLEKSCKVLSAAAKPADDDMIRQLFTDALEDRKSVVWGKRVSGSLDLGCRRVIKKKKK